MSRNIILGLVVVLVLGAGGWYFLNSQNSPTQITTPETTPTATNTVMDATNGAVMEESKIEENTVKITSEGFSPKNITIKVGDLVTWVNEDTTTHTVNSDLHPTHQDFPPLNQVGILKMGEKKSFTFTQVGTYEYHDHLNASLTGSVTVE